MQIDAETVFNDPRLMLFAVEKGMALFVGMTRESYARSIFFDRRLQPADPQVIQVPVDPLIAHMRERETQPFKLRFIHHFANSGSTLLARALDRPDNLVIREPAHLRQVGVRVGAKDEESLSQEERDRFDFSLAMLAKRFAPGSSVIVKGNVPISLLADTIAEANSGEPALLLHYPLEDYCAAVLKTENHQRWVEMVTKEIGLSCDPRIGEIEPLSTAEKAAALWYWMTKKYERLLERFPQMQSLDGNVFFERPAETLAAASDLLGAGLSGDDATAVAASPLFTTHSKNPNAPYDNATRLTQREETKARLAADLEKARGWIKARGEEDAVPTTLDRPLLGEPSDLL